MKTIFDEFGFDFVKKISERPEAASDGEFMKKSAAGAPQVGAQNVVNPCDRTPINQPLPPQIVQALNLTLLADYQETEFYSRGLNAPGLIPNELRPLFTRILLNEVGHRETLLTVLGDQAIAKPAFDFTANGAVPDPFSNFDTFTGLGQTFEDNGVRAIKGQAPNVMQDDFILTTALRFHSVEARHASELRRIRGQKGWITLNQRGNLPPISQPVYNGEENVVQGGINLVSLTGYPATTVSEAFDEPISAQQAMRNLAPFISGSGGGLFTVLPR